MPVSSVNLKNALQILGDVPLQHWRTTNIVPRAGHGKYPTAYLLRLKEYSGEETPTRERAFLCTLEWWTKHGDDTRRQWVCQEVEALQRRKKIATTSEAVAKLGYHSVVIRRWVKRRFLPAVLVARRVRGRIADTYVFLWSDVLHLKAIMDGLTSIEVASQLGLYETTASQLANSGRLKAVLTPLGYRFTQEEVDRFKNARQSSELTLRDAAALVGIPAKSFRSWIDQGYATPIVDASGHGKYIREDVLRIKEQRELLRGGFEGLDASIHSPSYPPKLAARKLGVSTHTLSVWTRLGFLPYFDLGPQVPRQKQRQYVAEYIDGLIVYAKRQGHTPSKELATAYKQERLSFLS